MNEYDSDRIADFVKKIDYIKTENIKDCDCYVINTCHIWEKETEKVLPSTISNKVLIIGGGNIGRNTTIIRSIFM